MAIRINRRAGKGIGTSAIPKGNDTQPATFAELGIDRKEAMEARKAKAMPGEARQRNA
jgi:hypothetical protein